MFGAQGMLGKNTFCEEAVRVAFLLRWPPRVAPRYTDACLNTPDIMPTLLSLMGLPVPAGMEGLDLSHRALPGTRMTDLGDTFEASAWYRDHWTKDRIITLATFPH